MPDVIAIENYKYQGLRYGLFTIHRAGCDCKARFGKLTGRKIAYYGAVGSLGGLAVKLMEGFYIEEMPGYGYELNIRPDDALEDMTIAVCLT